MCLFFIFFKRKKKQCICAMAYNKCCYCKHQRKELLPPQSTCSQSIQNYIHNNSFLVIFGLFLHTQTQNYDCLLSQNLAIRQLPVNPKPVKSTRITKTKNSFGTQSFKLFFNFLQDQTKQLALDDEYMSALDNRRHTQGTAGDEGTPLANCRTTPALRGRGNAVHEQPQCTKRKQPATSIIS